MKNRFKNMRRVPRSARTGLEFQHNSTCKGKSPLNHNWSDSGRIIDEKTYQHHKTALTHQQSTDSILILMKETAANRREWIKTERPTILTILKEFPCLKDYVIVSSQHPTLIIMHQHNYVTFQGPRVQLQTYCTAAQKHGN